VKIHPASFEVGDKMGNKLEAYHRNNKGKVQFIDSFDMKAVEDCKTLATFMRTYLAEKYGPGEYMFVLVTGFIQRLSYGSLDYPDNEEKEEAREPLFFLIAEYGPYDETGAPFSVMKFDFHSTVEADKYARSLRRGVILDATTPEKIWLGKVLGKYPVAEWRENEELKARVAYLENDSAYTRLKVAEGHIAALQKRFCCTDNKRVATKDKLVDELELSARAINALYSAELYTIGELVEETPQDLLRIKNLGRKTLKEIKTALKEQKLTLREV